MTSDRKFFSGMALAALLTVVAGFAPSYFFKAQFGGPQLAPLLHVHGAVFTAWMVLFLAQALLVAARRTDLHRRLGVAGGLLAVAIPLVGAVVAIGAAKRGVTPPGGPPPLVFLAVPLVYFGLTDLFVAACLVYDRVALGRVSRAFLWGGLFLVASQPLRLLVASTSAWLQFASWLTRD